MYGRRKRQLYIIIALVAVVASLSIGFAAFSATLNISSSASVTPNSDTFSVKFSTSKDRLIVSDIVPSSISSGVTASNGIIDNGWSPTITNLSAYFTNPGQYVEYTFYARNEGEYTAYLNNINFLGNKICAGETGTTASLVQSACDDIDITVTIGGTTYIETTPISAHALSRGTGEEIKVRLEYSVNGDYVDGNFSITFPDITVVYSTIDDSSMQSEKLVRLISGDLNTPGSVVAIGNEKFYVISQDNGNVRLFAKYNLYVGNVLYGVDNVDGVDYYDMVHLENPTGIQDSRAMGLVFDSTTEEVVYPFIGVTEFSSVSNVYEGSVAEIYVNNYVSYLESLGVNVVSSGLITGTEVIYLGEHVPVEVIFLTTYWVIDEDLDDGFHYIVGGYTVAEAPPDISYIAGIRPVIEIPLSEF